MEVALSTTTFVYQEGVVHVHDCCRGVPLCFTKQTGSPASLGGKSTLCCHVPTLDLCAIPCLLLSSHVNSIGINHAEKKHEVQTNDFEG